MIDWLSAKGLFRRNRSIRYLRGRDSLPDESFAALFDSPMEAEVGVSARRLLAQWIDSDVALVGPHDELVKHLGLRGAEAGEWAASVERAWKVKVPQEQLVQLRTIAQVAAAVAQRVGSMQARRNAAAHWSPTMPARPRKKDGVREPAR